MRAVHGDGRDLDQPCGHTQRWRAVICRHSRSSQGNRIQWFRPLRCDYAATIEIERKSGAR